MDIFSKAFYYIVGSLLVLAALTYGVYAVYNKGFTAGQDALRVQQQTVELIQNHRDFEVIKREEFQLTSVYVPMKLKYALNFQTFETKLHEEVVKHPEIVTQSCFPDSTFSLLNDAIGNPTQNGSLPVRAFDGMQTPDKNSS